MKHHVVGIGDVLWDCLPEGRKIGGAPANFAYYMRQFGFDSLLVSAIGNDSLGAEIIGVLNKMDLKHCLDISEYPTGTVMIELDGKGIPSYKIIENVAYDYIPYTPELDKIARECTVRLSGASFLISETVYFTSSSISPGRPKITCTINGISSVCSAFAASVNTAKS